MPHHYDENQLRIAADYLKEHWSPDQEEPDAELHETEERWATSGGKAYPGDELLIRYLPYYCAYNNGHPLFTERMRIVLLEIGVPVGTIEGARPVEYVKHATLCNYER